MRAWIWLGIALFLWIYGYVRVGFENPKGSTIAQAFVRPPTLIYYLAGLPRSPDIPRGVMAALALFVQFQAFLCLILAILSHYAEKLELRWGPPMLILGTVLNYFAMLALYHRYPYKKE